jgi:hypothetical protein
MGGLIKGLFGGGSVPKAPAPIQPLQVPKPEPVPTKDAAAESAQKELDKKRKQAQAGGKQGTIITGLGADMENTPVGRSPIGGR